ncbi:MAG: phosphatidate cytidylyltransferase [Oscillospiraceae bacterium]|nr:phosphatidate cytidylyltransferase [Oscillospiraceae bacterium]
MSTRVIVGVIAVPLLLLLIFLAPVWLLALFVGAVAACCAWEFLRCTEKNGGLRIYIYATLSAFCIPFFSVFFDPGRVYVLALFLLFVALFGELMLSFRHETTMEFETVSAALLAGGILPVLLAAIVRLALLENGRVYALLPFVAAFFSDTGAYFAGVFLGRHKLTPRLSPNKTIEGSVGGFLAAIGMMLLYGVVLRAAGFAANFAALGVYGFFGALAAQLGDLSFSTVKRLFGVKDYGNLIPGHGGALDRFDSMTWVAVTVELLAAWVPAITKAAVV